MSEHVLRTMQEAWKEAIHADGIKAPFLLLLMAYMTIPFLPFWLVLAAIERAGYYDIKKGFTLPDSGEDTEGSVDGN